MQEAVDSVNRSAAAADPAGEDLFDAMHAVMHLYRSEQYRSRETDGLAQMDGKVLRFFARNPGSTLKDLGESFSRDKGQLAKVIASLKQRGYLEARPDETDRRAIRLQLTDEGRSVQQALRRRTRRLAERAAADLSADDRRVLLALLDKVRANLLAAAS